MPFLCSAPLNAKGVEFYITKLLHFNHIILFGFVWKIFAVSIFKKAQTHPLKSVSVPQGLKFSIPCARVASMKNNLLKSDNNRNYKKWMPVKENIQNAGILRRFKEWELWWCAIGENVGIEINGKGDMFMRPVIVYHKFSRFGFMGIPLTSQDHTAEAPDWYIKFRFKEKDQFAAMHQLERISTFRLCRKMGELDDEDIKKIVAGFAKLYIKKYPL